MPWMESSVTEERLRFVARLLDGEAMTDVCRISGYRARPATNFRSYQRARAGGSGAIAPGGRSAYANQLPQPIESLIVRLKGGETPLGRAQDPRTPGQAARRGRQGSGKSTIHAVLDRHGLVKRGAGRATARAARRCPRAPRQ